LLSKISFFAFSPSNSIPECRVQLKGSVSLHRARHVAIKVERRRYSRVPQPFLRDLGMHASEQELRGMTMPKFGGYLPLHRGLSRQCLS
jgi:hypothetical protein